jgi:baculoviral IAP repeat-containing protein 6
MLPHASIGHLLALSQLPVLLGSLLRNDSVTDWIIRSEIYYAMIALLRRMADCELTVEVLIGQRFEMAESCGLEDWMWENGEISWVKDKQGRIERAPPLYEHFKKLTKQSEAFLAGALRMMENEEGADEDMDETINATSLCGDIIAARDDIERAMTIVGRGADTRTSASPSKGKGKDKNRDPAVDMENRYSQACENLAFKHIEMDYSQFNYASQLKATESSTRKPKDRLHLVKELATMATSLPPGIFVRVDEVRNDAMYACSYIPFLSLKCIAARL